MGGKVLEYEAKTILNQGRAEGRVEGEQKKAKEMALGMHKNGIADAIIASIAGVSIEVVRAWLAS